MGGNSILKPFKIQSHAALRAEMVAVARGDRPAPKDAAVPTFESIDVLLGLLTPANRALLAVIRDKKPRSVATICGGCPKSLMWRSAEGTSSGASAFWGTRAMSVTSPPSASCTLTIIPNSVGL